MVKVVLSRWAEMSLLFLSSVSFVLTQIMKGKARVIGVCVSGVCVCMYVCVWSKEKCVTRKAHQTAQSTCPLLQTFHLLFSFYPNVSKLYN